MGLLQELPGVLPYAAAAAVVLIGLGTFVGWVLRQFGGSYTEEGAAGRARLLTDGTRPPTQDELDAILYLQQQEMESEALRCPCGDAATHPAPRLVRERIDGKQAVYAAAPRYRREVPKTTYLFGMMHVPHEELPPMALCEAHAHMADAEMDQFIYSDIRAELAKSSQRIAMKAAEFETERLMQRIKDNLTEDQKKKVRTLQQKTKQLKSINGGPTSESVPAAALGE